MVSLADKINNDSKANSIQILSLQSTLNKKIQTQIKSRKISNDQRLKLIAF